MLAVTVVLMALGLVIAWVGIYIRQKGKTTFIAGNNLVFVPKNERLLAGRIGAAVLLFGIETVLFPLLYQLIDGLKGSHFAVLAVVHVLAVLVFMVMDQLDR
ncbi:hypothetical protein ACQCVO_13200 [Bacillus infantis]|uniref:hypothetical protein n=1 Tax=Bacillus infantis TaxID=324767 RepID=UPI003CF917E7